jgi:hypothetical protein
VQGLVRPGRSANFIFASCSGAKNPSATPQPKTRIIDPVRMDAKFLESILTREPRFIEAET